MSVAPNFGYETQTGDSGDGGRIPRHLHVAGADGDAEHTDREHVMDVDVIAGMEHELTGEKPFLRNPRWIGREAMSSARRALLSGLAAEDLLRHEIDDIGNFNFDIPPAIA